MMTVLSRTCAVVGVAFLAALSVPAAAPKADADGFAKVAAPFVKSHCAGCHGAGRTEADLSLAGLTADVAKNADLWRKLADRVHKNEMPPEDEPRPKQLDARRFVAWIDGELAKAGKAPPERRLLLSGNHVDHAALFDAKTAVPLDSPPRAWRISPHIYERLVSDIVRKKQLALPKPLTTSGKHFEDLAGGLTLDEPSTDQLIRNARAIVEHQTKFTRDGKGVRGVMGSQKEFVSLMDEDRPLTRPDIEAAIRRQFGAMLLREPTAEELARFVAFMEKNVKDAGRELGVRTTLTAVLLLPEVFFRLELGGGPPDAKGRIRLSGRETAYAVAYALTDARSDAALLAAASAGKLATAEGIAAQIDRVFADPKADTSRMLRFFREYFGYAEAIDVFKDDKEFRGHEARALVADTDRLVGDVLRADRDVFRELLTTRKSYVASVVLPKGAKKPVDPKKAAANRPKKAVYESYNLKDFPNDGTTPVDLPEGQRLGVLTQPAWLVAHSLNTENHPIRRGKWVRERLLGGNIPDLPITVDAQLPEDPKRTLRSRMGVTKEAYCWNCHSRMNDLGLAFEMYDHFGRYRTTEIGKAVDSSGAIAKSGDAKLDGPVKDAPEMIRRIADSDRARQVFVRHAFRYWMGREENLGDAPTLIAADKAYAASGGSMKALVKSLLTSESFLYRTAQR